MKTLWKILPLILLSCQCIAGIMPSQSRIIYKQQDREQTLMLANTNDYPVMIQTWVDHGEGDPETKDVPFISIPPISRLSAPDVKGVRIIYNPQNKLPQDRESLFWFNMYEVPPEKKDTHYDNSVLVAMNTQIKLFFRPPGITIEPAEAITQVSCRKTDIQHVTCNNPSPIHISVISATAETASGKKWEANNSDFILAPFSQRQFSYDAFSEPAKSVTLEYMDDKGQKMQYVVTKMK